MKPTRLITLLGTHIAVGGLGFALGVYALPILTAPASPTTAQIAALQTQAGYTGNFHRDLEDSDGLHWGEGQVAVSNEAISLEGKLAPGPDYKLYLSPRFIETEADFERMKPGMVQVGDVRTFENFVVAVPDTIDISQYTAVIIWCESFGEFITAARYQ